MVSVEHACGTSESATATAATSKLRDFLLRVVMAASLKAHVETERESLDGRRRQEVDRLIALSVAVHFGVDTRVIAPFHEVPGSGGEAQPVAANCPRPCVRGVERHRQLAHGEERTVHDE